MSKRPTPENIFTPPEEPDPLPRYEGVYDHSDQEKIILTELRKQRKYPVTVWVAYKDEEAPLSSEQVCCVRFNPNLIHSHGEWFNDQEKLIAEQFFQEGFVHFQDVYIFTSDIPDLEAVGFLVPWDSLVIDLEGNLMMDPPSLDQLKTDLRSQMFGTLP